MPKQWISKALRVWSSFNLNSHEKKSWLQQMKRCYLFSFHSWRFCTHREVALGSESVYPAKNKCSKNGHLAFPASLHIYLPWRICLQSLYCIFFTFQLQWNNPSVLLHQHPFLLRVVKLFGNYFLQAVVHLQASLFSNQRWFWEPDFQSSLLNTAQCLKWLLFGCAGGWGLAGFREYRWVCIQSI